jgi:hypothetical protein
MAKVHLVTARKDYPLYGIKKGNSYYWWKFNYGPKIRSKTAPKPSQLIRSEFLSTVEEIQEELISCSDQDTLNDIISRIRELSEEQSEKRSNMPENFQDVGSGEL